MKVLVNASQFLIFIEPKNIFLRVSCLDFVFHRTLFPHFDFIFNLLGPFYSFWTFLGPLFLVGPRHFA